jgi:hypothetical protein
VQIPHHTAVGLATYYFAFRAGQWDIPDFSEECPICGGEDCAVYWGFYTRQVIEPMGGLSVDDFPVMRFRCYRRGGTPRVSDVTFSLLPLDLVPFRRLSLKFMVAAVLLWLQRRLSRERAEEFIQKELVDMEDPESVPFASAWAQWTWFCLLREGLHRLVRRGSPVIHRSLVDGSGVWKSLQLANFLELTAIYASRRLEPQIRGPDALAGDFFLIAGGQRANAGFLFGLASQHRLG